MFMLRAVIPPLCPCDETLWSMLGGVDDARRRNSATNPTTDARAPTPTPPQNSHQANPGDTWKRSGIAIRAMPAAKPTKTKAAVAI